MAASPAPWTPDTGDGSYKNPVLFADYSDPDVIRVGDDYYLASSSFTNVPGLPVLHSRDLVNWTILSYALPKLIPGEHFSTPRHGEGIWAPAIRHHNGKFYIYYPDPDFGLYAVTAINPAGPWSEPLLVREGKGLIDPCPFWDEDGSVWLIHAWAGSRAGKKNILTLHRMSPDGMRVLDEGEVIIKGEDFNWTTLEGPKLYKRAGWYYVFAPVNGVYAGSQAVFRAKAIRGPYEGRLTLAKGSTKINGPHQGAWVDTKSGQDWFLHFQDMTTYGRVVHLQPMVWKGDGWPVMGADPDDDGTGEPVLTHAKPDVAQQPVAVPQVSDEFDGAALGLAWQWQANPRADWLSLSARSKWLRLHCVPTPANFYHAPNLLTQKFPAPEFVATTQLEFQPNSDGDAAGLFVFGYSYAWIGMRKTDTGTRLVLIERQKASTGDGGSEKEIAGIDLPVSKPDAPARVFLRLTVRNADIKDRPGQGAACAFTYSLDGENFKSLAPDFVFQAEPGKWVGAKFGIFAGHTAAAPSSARAFGHADYECFRVTH